MLQKIPCTSLKLKRSSKLVSEYSLYSLSSAAARPTENHFRVLSPLRNHSTAEHLRSSRQTINLTRRGFQLNLLFRSHWGRVCVAAGSVGVKDPSLWQFVGLLIQGCEVGTAGTRGHSVIGAQESAIKHPEPFSFL